MYGTFALHRSQQHTAHSSSDFQAQVVHKYIDQSNITDDIVEEAHCSNAKCLGADDFPRELRETEELKEDEIELKLGHPLLK